MSRPTRLRRPRIRDEDPPPSPTKPAPGASKLRKNTGIVEKDALVQLRSPVLRDRTNLTVESPKALMPRKAPAAKPSKKAENSEKKNPRVLRAKPKPADAPNPKVPISKPSKLKSSKSSELIKAPDLPKTVSKSPKDVPKNPETVAKMSKNIPAAHQEMTEAPKSSRPSRTLRKPTKFRHSPETESPPPKLKRSESLKTSVQLPKPSNPKSTNEKKSETPVPPEKLQKKKSTEPPRKSKRSLKSEKPENKFFKNKRTLMTHSKVSPLKRALRKPRKIPQKKLGSPPKAPTPEESFAKIKKTLRPRRTGKDYNEETLIEKKAKSAEIPVKAPIYKALNIEEDIEKDKNEVYDFSFDSNDSNECLPKKRKKKFVRKAPAKRAKMDPTIDTKKAQSRRPKKNSGDPKVVKKLGKKIPMATSDTKGPEKKIPESSAFDELLEKSSEQTGLKDAQKIVRVPGKTGKIAENLELAEVPELNSPPASPCPPSPLSNCQSPVQINEPIEVVVDVHVSCDAQETPKLDFKSPTKPTIISNKKLEGLRKISLTSTPLNANSNENSRPGSTNLFHNRPSTQYKRMLNHSLIRRSLSPIVKQASENFDDSSPWRPVLPETFSRVKNVFQSTPIVQKAVTPHGIRTLTMEKKVSDNFSRIQKIVEKDENDNSPKKSPRKFGTVLSNFASSRSLESPSKMSNVENLENKENVVSPKKIQKRNIFRSPQPGPSGIQNLRNLENSENSKTLKQSNLNNFLNIPEMPSSTRITTADGIFDDSGPEATVPGKVGKKFEDFDVRNAFGFDDESNGEFSMDSRVEDERIVAPIKEIVARKSERLPTRVIKPKIEEVKRGRNLRSGNLGTAELENILNGAEVEKNLEKSPQNLAIGKPKNLEKVEAETNLRIQRDPREENLDEIEKVLGGNESSSSDGTDGEEVKTHFKARDPEATKKVLMESVHFLDTFDAEERETNPVEVPLFVDAEPVHFKQPARYSYGKRKRGIPTNTSGDTEDELQSDDEEDLPKHKQKKHKMTKAVKEQQKQLDAWAKNINETFEEIDHFSLVVE